jgi:uncharacterized membrane protein HdeD (DUF308 family)
MSCAAFIGTTAELAGAMIRALIQNWWLLLMRGVFALVFAVFIFFFQPLFPSVFFKPMAYTAVAVVFGVLALATGLITTFAGLKTPEHRHHLWALAAEGIAITSGGLIVIMVPAVTVVEVIQIIAATALVVGLFQIVTATHVRRHLKDEWFLTAGGLASIAFAVVLFGNRTSESAILLNWIAIYAAASGLAMIGLARRLYGLRQQIRELSSPEHLESKATRTAI